MLLMMADGLVLMSLIPLPKVQGRWELMGDLGIVNGA